MLGVPPFPISIPALVDMIKTDIVQTIITFWDATMHAILGWTIIAFIVIPLIYFLFLPILRRVPIKGLKD